MRMNFPTDMPIEEQIKRAQGRKKVGHKHMHTIGPGKKKKKLQQKSIAWQKYKEQIALYFSGGCDTRPEPPT